MLAVHQDVINIVQAKFLSAEIVKSIHLNVSALDETYNDDNRILALVEYNKTFALFVLISARKKPISISDLCIETVIPIDEYFSCDTEPIEESQSHIIFIITSKKIKLQFKIEIGIESSNFASEVIRSKEVSLYNPPVFVWLDKYIGTMSQLNRNSDLGEQSDTPIIRQRITQGTTAINRESMLKYQLKLKEPEFTEKQEFTIFVGTWNVNGQPPSVSLRPWLCYDESPPDLYAIGFQEIDLSKEAFLFNDTPREAEWQKYVMEGMHPKAKYRLVALARLVGMQLAVMINSQHYPYVKNVSYDTVGTGLLGKMAVWQFGWSYITPPSASVNCHLAAHVEEFERRNQDYKDINARMNFKRNPIAIKDHEQVYWLGDLNYRITDLTTSQVKTLVARKELNKLLKADQLNQQKERGNVLLDYTEGDIKFQPTYKYDLNTDIFDTSEKARPPAWTDRILWRGKGIYQVEYRSHMDMRISDHKPVSSLFKSEISVVDPLKFRKIHEDLLKKMDKYENEYLPQVTVDQTEVKYDLVKFREPQTREIIIANTGMVPAEFEFIKKLDETSYCKDWLRIIPYCGSINPGETCEVKFEVTLETSLQNIYDILVLHLKGGKDMFITVSGDCQRSCFTSSIAALCRINVPIMQLSEEEWRLAENNESGVLYSVPREIWLMVDHLYRYAGTVQAVAESLLLFLSYTKDPVIPFELHDTCIAAASNFQNCRQIILQRVPDLHRNVFLYICMFLQELSKYSNDNGYDARTLPLYSVTSCSGIRYVTRSRKTAGASRILSIISS
ncbi:hypothetical protein NQ318_004480 [Aromia moschata]|uniref:Inositol polyphosphate-related phosphatase domain-containing protein n=1 Tax=Aromia moschata TaxID=1265417 RepID=A0AAV8XIA5_9CUCU|nr:hypothetical protein NQ318_004480 [Aromia moschata]